MNHSSYLHPMQPVANTPEIVYYKATNKYPGDALVQWAIDMLEAGYDTEHLRILAGETPPYDALYLQPLTDKVFNELGLDITHTADMANKYICWLIGEALSGNKTYTEVLRLLANLSYQTEDAELFSVLYNALDWRIEDVTWFFPHATRENLHDIITTQFTQWQHKHCGTGTAIPAPATTTQAIAAMVNECTQTLFTLAALRTTNTLSPHCLYIITEINNDESNFHTRRQLLVEQNDKKTPVPLNEVVPLLQQLYPLVYDFNFYIYKSTATTTVIDIRYYPKSSLNAEYAEKVQHNKPMVHCKLDIPFWIFDDTTRFDINWQHPVVIS